MGTSSARRGPTTALWRAAKGTATRYLSPAGGGEVTAGEVVARYLAAMEETPGQGEPLAVWRVTRKVAQALGAFREAANNRGVEVALQEGGLGKLGQQSPEMLAHALSGVLTGRSGGLEEAVAQTALGLLLSQAPQAGGGQDAGAVVRQFLATTLYLRLALDLGEPLEAAAGSYGQLTDGLNRIKSLIDTNVKVLSGHSAAPGTPDLWRGLAGWTWVTDMLAALMERFTWER
jgi:hypothetical protein